MSDETLVAAPTDSHPGPRGVWQRFLAPLKWVYCLLKILWLCGAAVVTLVAMAACFIWNEQGQDVLRMLIDPAHLRHPAGLGVFGLSVLCWSLATWYTSRLLLIRKLPGFPLPATATGPMREWTPRVLGSLPPAIMAVAFAHLDTPERPLAAAFALLTVLLFLFYWGRRRIVPGVRDISPQALLDTVPWSTRIIIVVALVLTFVLLGVFVAHPVGPARLLGAASILVLAATSVLLFFSIVLTYLPAVSGYPNLVLLVVLWSALCSPFNDNHYIHTVRNATTGAAPVTFSGRGEALQQAFQQWLEQAQAEARRAPAPGEPLPAADRPYPVFIVAAAGGGIRAAYWSAAVLAHAAAKVGNADEWRRHLFAMSGVSGGALGVSVHMVELTQGREVGDYLQPAERMLGADHIAPVLAFMLFPDMVQRFLLTPVPAFDRARALESSWEVSARSALGTRDFSKPFVDLWRKGGSRALPALLLNSVRAETGQRVIISSLPLSSDFVDAVDLLRPLPGSQRQSLEGITLAAAVHLSARFAYVSPAARLETTSGRLWGRLVDGGYFESSGAVTATELLRAICPDWSGSDGDGASPARKGPGMPPTCSAKLPASLGRIVPIVLLIKNDPEASSLCDPYPQVGDTSGGFFTEIKPPVEALLATRDARARVAQRSIVQLLEGHALPSGDCDDGCVLELSLAPRDAAAARERDSPYNNPPLGWSLSESSRAAMDRRFEDPDIQGQLECIANLAQGRACTTAQRCSRHESIAQALAGGGAVASTSLPAAGRP